VYLALNTIMYDDTSNKIMTHSKYVSKAN